MSDDPTRRLDRPSEPEGGRAPQTRPAMIAAVSVAALVVVVLFVMNREGDGPAVDPSPTASTATPSDSASPAEDATPTEDATDDTARAATDADAAEFSEGYRPDGAQAVQSATADVDGDGEKEVVVASIHSDAARIDIARWDGRAYRVVYTGEGGGAERLDAFTVADYTGDDSREIVTIQSIGAQGQSLSIWGWNGQAFAPQRASGGCWDGSHTLGVTGAAIRRGEIRATCDGSPLPTAAWPSDIYTWDAGDGGWVYDHTED